MSLRSRRKPGGPASIAEMPRDQTSDRTPSASRWAVPAAGEVFTRMMAERDGVAIAFLYGGHMPWGKTPKRFGSMRFLLHPKIWSETRYEQLVDAGEAWVRAEGGETGVARVRANITNDIRMLERRGYREVRRAQVWELDLIANRARHLPGAQEGREQMRKQGGRILTLDRDTDLDRLTKLYEMSTNGERDIPTTVPMHTMSFDEWHRLWVDNPGTRPGRLSTAPEGGALLHPSRSGDPPPIPSPSPPHTQ